MHYQTDASVGYIAWLVSRACLHSQIIISFEYHLHCIHTLPNQMLSPFATSSLYH